MNSTPTTPLNTDVAEMRDPFDVAVNGDERWYTVILGDLLPDWGEGTNKHDAIADLANSVRALHGELHDWPDDKLAEHLRHQRQFLCRLFDAS